MASFGFGQSNKILAKGNPNLTEGFAAQMQGVFEWTLQKEFDTGQAQRFRQILAGYWQNNVRSNIESCQEYLKVADLIGKIPADQTGNIRAKLLATITK